MTTMNKIFRLIAILLSVILIVGIAGCGGKSKTSKNSKKKSAIQEVSAQDTTIVNTPVSTMPKNNADPEDISVQLRVLPINEFGRDNPFVPLMGASVKTPMADLSERKPMAVVNMDNAKPVAKKPEPPPLPNVRLSLAIDGSTAIFDDNKASKVASVGDTVSGMKVLEIRGNEAVLGSGTKKFIVSQGGIREESPAPVQNNNIPKDTKIKKK
jgi:hypothetical protein